MSLFGYDQGVFSKRLHSCENQFIPIDLFLGGVVITKDFLQIHNLEGPTKTKTLSTVTAIYDVGCFLGAIFAFTLGERLGRKKSILWGTTIMAIGTVLQASSFSLPHIFVGRVVSG
jgi:MFS family permease